MYSRDPNEFSEALYPFDSSIMPFWRRAIEQDAASLYTIQELLSASINDIFTLILIFCGEIHILRMGFNGLWHK